MPKYNLVNSPQALSTSAKAMKLICNGQQHDQTRVL